jgi:hypothetical protein
MSSYSVSGYISSLMIREKVTLLVEGVGDKRVISRVLTELHDRGRLNAAPIVVDTADLLRGDDAPMGNRALVERAHELAMIDGVPLHAVVDREFRKFSLNDPIADLSPIHKVVPPSLYWTRGHSTENYFFDPACLSAFLKQQFPESLKNGFSLAIQETFHPLLRWACSVSLALFSEELLERSESLGQASHWKYDNSGEISLDVDAYVAAFASRKVPPERISLLKTAIEKNFERLGPPVDGELFRWLSHGHAGWELLWCGVAAVLAPFCSTPAVVASIATGYREQKVRCAAEIATAQVITGENMPLPELWSSLAVAANQILEDMPD